jgi:hypothetical protein
VAGRALASIHPTKPFVTAVPFLGEEIEYIMGRRRALAASRAELAKKPENANLVCAGNGRLVMDAVRDKQGLLYDAKVAKLREIDTDSDPETTMRARGMIEANAGITCFEGAAASWKSRFPSPTEDLMAFS